MSMRDLGHLEARGAWRDQPPPTPSKYNHLPVAPFPQYFGS
jgi:hypothetical protein